MRSPSTPDLIEKLNSEADIYAHADVKVEKVLRLAASRLADLEREREEAVDNFNRQLSGHRKTAQMLSAAERSLQEAKGVMEPFARAADAMQPPIGEYIGRDGIRGTLTNVDFRKARAFLNRSAADGEGYGSPRPTLNADEGPGTNPQPDKSREGT